MDRSPSSFNLLADLPKHLPQELVQTLLTASNLRIERIVSLGHRSPDGFWYDQETHEWILLLSGKARLRFEGEAEAIDLAAGDWVNIPAHRKHRVDWTDPDGPTVWLAVHYA